MSLKASPNTIKKKCPCGRPSHFFGIREEYEIIVTYCESCFRTIYDRQTMIPVSEEFVDAFLILSQ
jgi:hypothetical protein